MLSMEANGGMLLMAYYVSDMIHGAFIFKSYLYSEMEEFYKWLIMYQT